MAYALTALELAAREETKFGPRVQPGTTNSPNPPWASTIHELDQQCGGFYGMSVLAGDTGTQKTTTALATCLRAATDGWRVLYLGAELDSTEISNLMDELISAHPAWADGSDLLHALDVNGRCGPVEIIQLANEIAEIEDPHLLICIDSLNTVAQWSGPDFWRVYTDLSLWAMRARKLAEGVVSFLLVSELNQQGVTKGRNMEYWADLVLRIRRDDANPNQFALDTRKARRGGMGHLGNFHYDWNGKRWVREAF
jgi:predicted ATP-dependent serine protease